MKIQNLLDKQLFAEICGFYQQYADVVNIGVPDFEELQTWLVQIGPDVAPGLIQVHKNLLQKNKIFFTKNKGCSWEMLLKEFCENFWPEGADALENEGAYGQVDLSTRLEILRALQDTLFDRSSKLANFTKIFTDDMRAQHLGKDRLGQRYVMYFSPKNLKLKIYCKSRGYEYFVASNRNEILCLIKRISLYQRRNPGNVGTQWEEKQLVEFLNVLACSYFQ